MNEFSVDEPRYTRMTAAELANVSLEFLEKCEREQLVRVRISRSEAPVYSARDIRDIARIARLHRDLDLDLAAIEVVLHMRRQVLDLREQLADLELEMLQREEGLRKELNTLRRRLATESIWSVSDASRRRQDQRR